MDYLKCITLEKAGVTLSDDEFPKIPKKWRHFFAMLATVNRAFHSVSTGVLWEYMDSLEPFFGVLLPSDPAAVSNAANPQTTVPSVG